MEIFDTMDTVRCIHGKRYAIQTFPTDNAAEAFWMIWFAGCSQYPIQDGFLADTALLQGILKEK